MITIKVVHNQSNNNGVIDLSFAQIDIMQCLKNTAKGDWMGEKNSPGIQVFMLDEWD
jgi:hypothetical protein